MSMHQPFHYELFDWYSFYNLVDYCENIYFYVQVFNGSLEMSMHHAFQFDFVTCISFYTCERRKITQLINLFLYLIFMYNKLLKWFKEINIYNIYSEYD